ncbi:hypothetical protein [Bradyrhizobium sp. RT9a]|uniref:hypothetical protein n=1 Tax=Bradyrhizobium sp. RT9a TaxID=3156384 RepID=UPI00339B0CE1
MKELFDTHGVEAPALYSDHLIGDGQEMFEHAALLNYEGNRAKMLHRALMSGRVTCVAC